MKLLVIGSGGREHAIAWRLAQSPRVQKVYVAPGNGGTARESGLENLAISASKKLAEFALVENIHLAVVGPEAPLAEGIVDLFRSKGLRIFGPTRACARLESSKQFAKEFMARHRIPTAAFAGFDDARAAHDHVDTRGAPIVVKADGLAAGKGVIVAMSSDEAHQAIDRILVERAMGAAGSRVVIEEFLEGEEASFIVLADGEHLLPLATSQDHKRLLDGDRGPNTGGMGAYSPAPAVTPELHARVVRAGTALKDGAVVTSGGRVVCVTALGDSIKMAQRHAYEVVEGIRFDGMQYRRDIGYRAVAAKKH